MFPLLDIPPTKCNVRDLHDLPLKDVTNKITTRHPHSFSSPKANCFAQVPHQWQKVQKVLHLHQPIHRLLLKTV